MPRLIVLLLLSLMAAPALAQAEDTARKKRPVVALVLSGGGAKGMAHVGVLRALEEMHVPVDIVVGTSAGSAVAALYALGMDVNEIEDRFIEMDWLSSFQDSPGRAYKPVRRKVDDWRYPVDPGIGVSSDGFVLGRGLVAGQNLGFILNELTRNAALARDFDNLPLRFRAVATDLETGEQVVIRNGSLAEAIRASMSIPGVYAPTERDGRLLVDGGIANNLPVSVAQSMGADVVIAVDISDALQESEKLTGAFSVVGQLTTLMTRRNVDDQLALMDEQDVLIRPSLEGLSSADFYDATQIIESGATATRNKAVSLNRLRVGDVAWAEYQQHRTSARFAPDRIADVRIDHDSRLSREFLRSRIHQQPGEPLDVERLEDDLRRIYGLGYYETVSYSLVPSDDPEAGAILVIEAKEKSWGPNYLKFGLSYEDNFESDTRFNVGGTLQMTELNALGAEWNTGLQLGTEPYLRTEWFQPLDFGYRRFALAGVDYERDSYSVFNESGDRVGEVEVEEQGFDVSLGLELGAEGEIRAGYRRGTASVDDVLGDSNLSESRIDKGAWTLQGTYDSLNDPFLPSSGAFFGLEGRFERPGLGSDRNYDRATLLAAKAAEWGRQVVVGQAFASSVTKGEAGVEDYVSLGGFHRLSAYARGEVTGQDAALLSLYTYRRFGGPIVPFFAGVSYEGGNGWQDIGNAKWTDVIHSYGVFAGINTFLGPVQVSSAWADDEHWTLFLTVGYSLESLFINY
ncbi:patatin-like phospholipase family protein [Marinobacter bohaiensis]|uniref:patatin-like phospholipase family protein n=1 Tax=Marinobacter bohaiensis TaxID=2201898 RepID=UPI001D17AD57|nr:patatin-like phospholipase family protein [Marinobacter bohaiensis]